MKRTISFTPKSWGIGIGFDLATKSSIMDTPLVVWIQFAMWTIDFQFGEYKSSVKLIFDK